MMIPPRFTFMSQQWMIRPAGPKELVDCLGQCDPGTNTIILDANLPSDVMLQTLTHELFHCMEMTLNQCLTEQQVDTMSAGLLHLFRSNPNLLALYHTEVVLDEDTE
jgi:hypothetical protein